MRPGPCCNGHPNIPAFRIVPYLLVIRFPPRFEIFGVFIPFISMKVLSVITATSIGLATALDVTDPIFDLSWESEVPMIANMRPSDIWNYFFNASSPVKTTLPALQAIHDLWTDEYMKSSFGEQLVRTEPGRENRTVDYCGLERLGEVVKCGKSDYEYTKQLSLYYTLTDFLGNMTSRNSEFNRYVITALPDIMAGDLPFLPGFGCGLRRRFYPVDEPSNPLHMTQVSELNFWLSKGSTYSAIHYDMNHQIMCQISGKKEWRFWDLRTELNHIPMWSGFYPDTMSSDDSPIDPLDVDLVKYPDFIKARWMNTTLSPGECLLIPSRHALHFVRSFPGERNMGFSVHVSRDYNQESLYSCDDSVANLTSSSLGDFQVMWPFPGDPRESGYNTVRMGYGDWKIFALFALKRMSQGVSLRDAVSDLTNGRSRKSKRITAMLETAPPDSDVKGILSYGPLWREVYTLVNN